MEGLAPLVFEVYDKDFNYQGMIDRPQAVTLTPRHNAVGGGAFTLDSDSDAVEALADEGAQLRVQYRYDPDDPQALMHLLGGPVNQLDLTGVLSAPTRGFSVLDHWGILNGILCRGASGSMTTPHSVTGPAETVIKTIVSANLSTFPTPMTVATTHGWGETITVQVLRNKLTDRIFPALNYSHVGISVRMVEGAGLVLDAYLPTVHAEPLTAASNIVTTGRGSRVRPTVSRVLVQGGSPASVFRSVVNTAVENEWGFCGEEVVDVSESTTNAYLDAKGWEVLNAGAPQAAAEIELAETDEWRYGLTYNLGDEVTVELAGGAVIPDVITEVEITWDTDSGLLVKPKVGNKPSSPDETVARAIEQIAARQRVITARS